MKQERTDLNKAKRSTLVNKKMRKRRVREIGAGASIFVPMSTERSIFDGAEVYEGTNDGVPDTAP